MKLEFQKVKNFLCDPERIAGMKNVHEAQASLGPAGTAHLRGVGHETKGQKMKIFVASPVGAAAGGTNPAIGHRCHSLAWAFGLSSCVPLVNATLD